MTRHEAGTGRRNHVRTCFPQRVCDRRRWGWGLLCLFVGALALLVGGVGLGLTPSAHADTQIFHVKPGAWQPTGIQLKKGQAFEISTTGSLNYSGSADKWGPGGTYQLGFYAYNLKGRFGAGNSTLFDVALYPNETGGSFTAPADGQLELGITRTYENIQPDDSSIEGEFTATVTWQTPSAAAPPAAPLTASLNCDTSALPDSGQVTCTASVQNQAPNAQLTYQWSVDGQAQASATGAAVTVSNLAVGDHQVSVTASDTANNASAAPRTASFTRTANAPPPAPPPPALNTTLACDTGALPDSGQVTCTASVANQAPNAQITYQWTVDGQAQSGVTGNVLSLSNLAPGEHQVSVTASDTINNVTANPQTTTFTRQAAPNNPPPGGGGGPAPSPPPPAPPLGGGTETPTGGSGGGGGLAGRIALAGGAGLLGLGIGEETLRRAQAKKDAENAKKAAYNKACQDLCQAKKLGPRVDADVTMAENNLKAIEAKWREATDYLTNQLRKDYAWAMKKQVLWSFTALVAAGLLTSGAVQTFATLYYGEAAAARLMTLTLMGRNLNLMRWRLFSQIFGTSSGAGAGVNVLALQPWDPGKWNQDVDTELKTGFDLINGIHADKVREWQDKLQKFKNRADKVDQMRYQAENALVNMRASNPDITFGTCECE